MNTKFNTQSDWIVNLEGATPAKKERILRYMCDIMGIAYNSDISGNYVCMVQQHGGIVDDLSVIKDNLPDVDIDAIPEIPHSEFNVLPKSFCIKATAASLDFLTKVISGFDESGIPIGVTLSITKDGTGGVDGVIIVTEPEPPHPVIPLTEFKKSMKNEILTLHESTLGEIIRTKNGRVYLGMLSNNLQFLSKMETPDRLRVKLKYDPDIEYPGEPVNFQELSRKFKKTLTPSLKGYIQSTGCNAEIAKKLLRGEINHPGDMFGFEDNHITFYPYNKCHLDEVGKQKIAVHRFIKDSFNPNEYTERDLECYADELRAIATKTFKVSLVTGSQLAQFYSDIRTSDWASSSCMSGKSTEFFKIYADNPDVCQLGIIYDEGLIVGRFLRWKTDEKGWINDRLYFRDSRVEAWYSNYCRTQKMIYRYRNSYDLKQDFMTPDNDYSESVKFDLTVSLTDEVRLYDYVPYADTFTFTDGDASISNDSGEYSLDTTDGENYSGEGSNRVWDEWAEQYIDEDDAVMIDFGRMAGSYTHSENVYYSEANGGHALI